MENKNSNVVYLNICQSCGKNMKNDWKICPYCKVLLKTFKCYFCGHEIRYSWNYCPHCKAEVKTEINNKVRIEKCNEWLSDILK